MEYISAEEFLKQPKKVQEVFLDWWKPSKGDLFTNDITGGFGVIAQDKLFNNGLIPLLTEGQLRKFIEDKKSGIIDIGYYGVSEGGYEIKIYKLDYKKDFVLDDETGRFENYTFEELGTDLLQAYWKVACEIAKEE
ncbi:hypothetical protein [Clostridium botulinum]|uniref:hypothetical protein n=1 Tax=Clostridium botulinum TaxID=1491 RepID=UPI0019687F27|nr:hypothetical protein [Clostridium botulinum]MBN1059360.1 hypothetical protein [Clostridium botulinum]